jgi:hypothetical protein
MVQSPGADADRASPRACSCEQEMVIGGKTMTGYCRASCRAMTRDDRVGGQGQVVTVLLEAPDWEQGDGGIAVSFVLGRGSCYQVYQCWYPPRRISSTIASYRGASRHGRMDPTRTYPHPSYAARAGIASGLTNSVTRSSLLFARRAS